MSIQRYDILHPKMRDKGRFVLYADHIADKDAELHNLLSTLADIRIALGVGEKPMLSELAGIVRTRMGVIKILEREVKDHAAEVKRLTYNYDQCKSRLDDMSSEVERLTAERYAAVRERDEAVEALRRLLTLIECASNLPDEAANRIEAFGVDEGVYHASRIIGEAKAILAKIKGERG